jgi:hypothetical protein
MPDDIESMPPPLLDQVGLDQVGLDQHAVAIRGLLKTTKDSIIEIGRRLVEGKKLVGRGQWLRWLDREFGWTDDTARRFINIYEFSQREEPDFRKLRKLDLPVSGLYLLAEPSTPAEARTEIIEGGQSRMPVAEVKRVIGKHKKSNASTSARGQPSTADAEQEIGQTSPGEVNTGFANPVTRAWAVKATAKQRDEFAARFCEVINGITKGPAVATVEWTSRQ